MPDKIREALINAVKQCPCCNADIQETNGPEAGIPDDAAIEIMFLCGGGVFVTTENTYRIARQPCPYGMQAKLDEIQEEITDQAL